MKKVLILCLALFMVLGCVGCKGNNSEHQTTDAQATEKPLPPQEIPTDEQDPLKLIERGRSLYEVVCSETADTLSRNAAIALQAAFKKETGVVLGINDDYLREGATHDDDTCKILVGATNYKQSQEAYKGLKYYDYFITVSDSHLVVVSYTEDGYTQAIEWLTNKVFAKTTGDGTGKALTMKAQAFLGSTNNNNYDVDSWTLNGNELKNYQIVYSDPRYESQVRRLKEAIGLVYGHYLPSALDTESEAQPYEILIGDTNRAESQQVEDVTYLHYAMKMVNGKLVIKTGGMHSLRKIAEAFTDYFTQDGKNLTAEVNDWKAGNFYSDPFDYTAPEGTDIRIMSANLMAENYTPLEETIQFPFDARLEIFLSALDFYNPTVVGIQEACLTWNAGFRSCLDSNKWALIQFDNCVFENYAGDVIYSAVIYRKDLLTLVDSGMQYYSAYNNHRCRCITWALLKVNSTGKEFCFVSTHWDPGNTESGDDMPNTYTQSAELTAFVNEMHKRCPVFTTGDFNRNQWKPSFKGLLNGSGSVDCMYAAINRLNEEGSIHGMGISATSHGSCDHITASESVKVLTFETLIYNEQIYSSDHSWLMADIQF